MTEIVVIVLAAVGWAFSLSGAVGILPTTMSAPGMSNRLLSPSTKK